MRRRIEQKMPHYALGIAFKRSLAAGGKGAIGNEAVERIADKCKFEITRKRLFTQMRADILETEVPMPQPRELWNGELLFNEKPCLFHIIRPHMCPQRLTHRMRTCFGYGDEYESVQVRHNHGS